MKALVARGIFSLNGSDLEKAEQYFRKAWAINPYDQETQAQVERVFSNEVTPVPWP